MLKMTANEYTAIATAIHVLECNIMAARYGIISDDAEMILDSINQIEAIVSGLKRKTVGDAEKAN
jgi:hypothetical protein